MGILWASASIDPYLEESGLSVDGYDVTSGGTTVEVVVIFKDFNTFYYSLYLTHVDISGPDLPVLHIQLPNSQCVAKKTEIKYD